MKTPSDLPPPHAALAAGQPSGFADTLPACWRSEAFAEDLYDTLTPVREAPASHRRPALLRRALAAVLRR